MPDPLDLPALRAVRDAAAILRREVADNWANDVPDIRLRKVDPKALMLAILSDLTAIADACERLAEENERMREALVRVVAHTALPHHPRWDLLLGLLRSCARIASDAITPAPAGKGEG